MDKKLLLLQPLKLVIFLLLLFWGAGTWNYWQGWIFFIYMIILMIIILFLFKDKMDLGKERLHPGKGMKAWDKVIAVFGIILFMAIMIIAILDSGRYKWSQELPMSFYIISYIILTLGNTFIIWAMYTNKWFSSVARIQKDRNQKVCSSGPYKFVRHPGYFGGFFMIISLPLVFGSLYALPFAILMAIIVIVRTALEDNMLKKELKGYKEYTKKTRYRLFPGLW